MISNECELMSVEMTNISQEINVHQRQYITARRRSLSGSAVATKAANQKLNFGLKSEKHKFKMNGQSTNMKTGNSTFDSTDCIHSDVENSRYSVDSNSLSTRPNSSGDYRKSNSLLFTNAHRGNISATTKIKHFLAEHIVKIHPCHHPEYHFHKKASDISITNEGLKTIDFQEMDFQEQNSYGSSNSSSSKDISSPRPKSAHDNVAPANYTNMASTVLDRIRHMNIQSIYPATKIPTECESSKRQSLKESLNSSHNSNTSVNETNHFFPSPEPNPYKLPKVISPSSIMFSSKLIANHKPKRHRLAHSVSLDSDYKLPDACKFSPEKDKWERKISGYLDTSTPTGAALTAINFGLKKVTETDKYLMITKSPISSPNEFLEDGISHLQDSKTLFRSLLQHTSCYDLMPDSGKIIIIDSQMQIGKAFDALEDNVVRASPIWSSEKQGFIALLTVNDIIPLLLHLHQLQKGNDHCCKEESFQCENFNSETVEKCLSIIPRFRTMQAHIAGVLPETNLYSVTNMLSQLMRSKVVVLDEYLSGNPLFILSDLRILVYLTMKMRTMNVGSCFNSSIRSETSLLQHRFEILQPLSNEKSTCEDLCISVISKTQYVVYSHSTIIDVLRAMARSYHTCALIRADEHEVQSSDLDQQFIIKDIITISDILHLVMINMHRNSTITALQILQYRNQSHTPMTYRDPVVSCSIDDSVQHLIDLVVKEKASFALIRANQSISSPTIFLLTPIDILNYICKQSSSPNYLPSHSCIIADLNKVKKPVLKYSLERLRQNSDLVGCNRNSPKILDDTLEEVFNIDVS